MAVRLAFVAGVCVRVHGVGGAQHLVLVRGVPACMPVSVLVLVGMRVYVRMRVRMRVVKVAVPMPVLVRVRVFVDVPVFVRMSMFDVGHTDPLSKRVDRTPTGVMRVRAARIRTARKKGPQTRPFEVAPAGGRRRRRSSMRGSRARGPDRSRPFRRVLDGTGRRWPSARA
jgi:hypothetical protein